MTLKQIMNWLLDGDISIQYQVYRDLLDKEKPALQKRISSEGWGRQFLKYRQKMAIGDRVFINLNGYPPIILYLI